MATPTAGDVHSDQYLSDFSTMYINGDNAFVAGKVFPSVGVQKQSDKYAIFTKADFLRSDMERRAPGTASAGTSFTVSSAPYHTEDWSLHQKVANATIANADDPFRPIENATKKLAQAELIKREEEWASAFFTTGVWANDKVGGTDFTEIGDLSSDPVNMFSDYAEAVEDITGNLPRDLVVSRRGWNKLRNHPDIIARVLSGGNNGSPAQLSLAAVASVLDLDRIHVAAAIKNTAAEGAAGAYSRIIGNDALLCYVDKDPQLEMPTSGLTFRWDQYIGSSEGRQISRWYDQATKSEYVEIDANWDMRVIGADLGVFMSGFVAAA